MKRLLGKLTGSQAEMVALHGKVVETAKTHKADKTVSRERSM